MMYRPTSPYSSAGLALTGALAASLALAALVATASAEATAPYPTSDYITGIAWDRSTYRSTANGSDIWPVTWGADDRVYTAWGDGDKPGCSAKVSYGIAALSGGPSANLINIHCGPTGDGKGKVASILSVDGTLYALMNLQNRGWPNPDFTVWWSQDNGRTWQKPSWAFPSSNGSIRPDTFINFGKDYANARDEYVYMPAIKIMDDMSRPEFYLMRAPKSGLKDKNQYTYFAGLNGNTPIWSNNAGAAKPVFTDPNKGMQFPVIVHNRDLNRYILTVAHGHGGKVGIFEGPEPWGPWKTIAYEDNWLGISGGYFLGLEFPTKWITDAGKTMWGVFSVYGSGTGTYHDKYNLMKATLTVDSPSGPVACHLLTSADPVPAGFGAAYNVLSAQRELLLRAACTDAGAVVTVGSGLSTQYVYRYGYEWRDGQWHRFELAGDRPAGDSWYIGEASATFARTAAALAQPNHVVGYVCTWTGAQWKCGCRDSACTQAYWQLQAFQRN